jgi:transposase
VVADDLAEARSKVVIDLAAEVGQTEGRTLIIKQVKRQGFGYRNPDNYRLRVLYRCL